MKANFNTFVVVNPVAGGNRAAGAWKEMLHTLRSKLQEVEFSITESVGHATDITRRALKDGWEQIVSIGGDGTNNEVLNGFFEPLNRKLTLNDGFLCYADSPTSPTPINPNAVLALTPFGTGGDFRKTLKIGQDVDANIQRLLGRDFNTIDIGEVAYTRRDNSFASRLFLNIAGGGFSGKVVELANRSIKDISRGMTFQIASTLSWFGWSNPLMQLNIDGALQEPEKMFNLAIANGEYFGGGMHVAKGAHIDDGLFDVIQLQDFNRFESFMLMFRIFSAKHLQMSKVKRERARQIHAKSVDNRREISIDVDGEDLGKFPATFTLHPAMVRLKS